MNTINWYIHDFGTLYLHENLQFQTIIWKITFLYYLNGICGALFKVCEGKEPSVSICGSSLGRT